MVVKSSKCLNIVLLYHAIWPDDYLTYDAITLYSTHPYRHIKYLTLILDSWYLTPDIWHLIFDTWQLTCYHLLDMLSHGTSTLDLIFWHLTGLLLHLHYNVHSWLPLLRGLGMIIILLPDILYFWTPVLLTPVFLNPCNRETPYIILLLIPVIR